MNRRRTITSQERAEVFEAAREAGYDIEKPRPVAEQAPEFPGEEDTPTDPDAVDETEGRGIRHVTRSRRHRGQQS